MRHHIVLMGLLLCAGCSRGVDSAAAGVRYEPPSGMKLVSEEPGPPPTLRFERGLELRSFPSPLQLEEGTLPAALAQVREELGGALPQEVVSSRAGTLPAGKVGRFELDGGRTRTLLYAVDGGQRHLVLTLTAPTGDFDRLANRLERSLSTLQLR